MGGGGGHMDRRGGAWNTLARVSEREREARRLISFLSFRSLILDSIKRYEQQL